MAIHIKADGSKATVSPADGSSFTLEELQAFVGGYIEYVRTAAPVPNRLVVNEEGKLRHLPINTVATRMWIELYGPCDYIVGDCLLATLQELGEEQLS